MSALLSPAQVTERLGISRQTLVRWERAGQLVRDSSSARPRYRSVDVDALAEALGTAPRPGDQLLGAAADLLRERGTDGCTVEAVAERVGLTRAGVVHHHPTKEHLLDALARRFLDEFEAAWQRETAETADGPGRLCRAYAAVTLRPSDEGLGPAVLACAMDSPAVRELVAGAVGGWYARLGEEDAADGLGGDGLRTCLAADGLWLLGLLHLSPLSGADRSRAFPPGTPLRRRQKVP